MHINCLSKLWEYYCNIPFIHPIVQIGNKYITTMSIFIMPWWLLCCPLRYFLLTITFYCSSSIHYVNIIIMLLSKALKFCLQEGDAIMLPEILDINYMKHNDESKLNDSYVTASCVKSIMRNQKSKGKQPNTSFTIR